MNNKGVSEIISQILLMLVTVVVVGIIIAAIVPQISRGKSQIKFEESKLLRDNLYSNIQEVYNSPIGYTKEISLKLENLSLNIDGDTETIEIYSIIDGEFYKDGLRQEEGNGKYTYRNGQKLYAGFTLENIDIVRSYVLENQLNATIYLRKTDKDKITILLENVIEDSWFTSSNLGLYNETPSTWQYRKKILIDGNKVDGNLTNFPVLIYLNDFDLNLYAKSDGSDIIFTSKDGKTKLKREIEDYNSDTGILYAWVKVPELTIVEDTSIYIYFGNSSANEQNDKDVWDEEFVGVWHKNDLTTSTIKDSTINENTGTKVSVNNPIQTAGKIGYAQSYDGSDYITITSTTIQTASLWTNLNSVTGVQYFLGGITKGIRYNGTDFLVYNGSTGYVALNWTKEDNWKYITVTKINSNDYNFYVDGDLLGVATAGTNGANIEITLFGKRNDGYSYNGPIDEVRISNIARSEQWIKTEYNNQSTPEEFIKVGILEKA